MVACVIGEGGSGGAIATALADCVLMQENAIYTVISPEGCAAILWRDAGEAKKAAAAFKPDAVHFLKTVSSTGSWPSRRPVRTPTRTPLRVSSVTMERRWTSSKASRGTS